MTRKLALALPALVAALAVGAGSRGRGSRAHARPTRA